MSKFNTSKTVQSVSDAINMAGGASYDRKDIKKDIASVVLTSMLSGDSYYESEKARLARIESMCKDPAIGEFVAKAGIYARAQGNLRSISHFLAVILAENVKGEKYLRPAFVKSFVRPDDLTEVLALWNSRNAGKSVPNALRRAMKDALETFDDYQMKKYSGENKTVKLRDVVKLAHPVPGENRDFKALIEGRLDAIQTAQTVNAAGTGEARAESYKTMLANRKLGLMAALKNIKNIVESGADQETIQMLCDLVSNEKVVQKSRVLPFRFIQAFEIVNSLNMDRLVAKKIIKAVEDGFIASGKNLPFVKEGERVALLLDESGSMDGGWSSSGGSSSPFYLGKTMMASVLTGLNPDNTVGYLWADRAREITISGSPFDFIARTKTKGGGTDVWAAIEGLIKSKTVVDKLVIFTDMQMYEVGGGYLWADCSREFKDMVKEYRKISPNAKVLFWDLQGYGGGTPMKLDHNILEVSGFSDKILEVASKMLEFSDKDFLVKEIEDVQL